MEEDIVTMESRNSAITVGKIYIHDKLYTILSQVPRQKHHRTETRRQACEVRVPNPILPVNSDQLQRTSENFV